MRIVGNNPQLSRQTQATASGAITGGKPVVVNTDGTVSVPDPDSVGSATIFNTNYTNYIIMAFDSNSNKIAVCFLDGTSSVDDGTGVVINVASANLTSENFIGFSDGAFADGQSAVINTTNTIDRNQSSLTAGQTLFVQTDGTLSETADDPSVTAGTAISATEIIVKG